MGENRLSVREISVQDIDPLLHYWLDADPSFLIGMGVDLKKVPSRGDFSNMLLEQMSSPYEAKKSYALIWLLNGKPIGHSNISKIIFGEEAYMHLHLWNGEVRKSGYGTALVKMTLPWYFKNFHLKKLYCEPYALNPAPNKTIEKVGFKFIKNYITTPGWINFEQPVNLWEMTYERYKELNS